MRSLPMHARIQLKLGICGAAICGISTLLCFSGLCSSPLRLLCPVLSCSRSQLCFFCSLYGQSCLRCLWMLGCKILIPHLLSS